MRQILIISLFILAFSVFASAQEIPPSYGFLEVVDYKNAPVADASVRVLNRGVSGYSSIEQGNLIEKTDSQGRLEKGIAVRGGFAIPFSIDKPGFYPFIDCFGLFDFLGYGWRNNKDKPVKIELLKIPETRAEEKAVGREQQKRELFLAAFNSDAEAVRKLLKSGLSPNLTTSDLRGLPVKPGVPVIYFVLSSSDRLSPDKLQILKLFLDAGADIRKKDSPAGSILLTYLRNNVESLRYSTFGHRRAEEETANPMRFFEEGLDILVKAGADIEAADKNGDTALTITIRHGHIGILKKLLALGYSGKTKSEALQYLIDWKDVNEPHALEMMDLLLKSGADPNFIIDKIYRPPLEGCASLLMLAAGTGRLDFIKLLLTGKADPNLKCKYGKTAVIAALEGEQPEAAKMLLENGATGAGFGGEWRRRTSLMVAAAKGYVEIAEMLLAKGFSVKDRDEWDETALEIAIDAKAGKEMIELLLKAGADPNGHVSPYCKIPLTYSSALGRPDILRLLIAYEADVNLKCGGYNTPIVEAARDGEAEAVKILLEAGANITGEQGQQALKYARENLQKDYPKVKASAEEIIKLLETAGAK